MSKTTMITARVDPKLKREAEKVLRNLGLTTTQAITLFFNQISLRKGLPFAVSLPNTETAQAIDEALAGVDLHTAESVQALMDELESCCASSATRRDLGRTTNACRNGAMICSDYAPSFRNWPTRNSWSRATAITP